MPITPSYTWQESPSWVTIHIALRSVSPANIDILTTDCYVKVNCHPYLFQIDLFGDIEINKSSAVVDSGTVRFFLVKKQNCLWGRLNAVGERKDILFKREKSLESERQRTNKLKTDAKSKAAQIGRLAVQNQMKLDQDKRKLMEERKADELRLERDMIQSWQAKVGVDHYCEPRHLVLDSPLLESESGSDSTSASCTKTKMISNWGENDLHLENQQTASSFHCITGQNETTSRSPENTCSTMHEIKQEILQTTKVYNSSSTVLPAPREHVSVCVQFTPKSLSINLPARESRGGICM